MSEETISVYDIEFMGLLQEITTRIVELNKGDRIKIDKWIKCLMLPSKSTECKRNRNLYAIKLLDNLINNRLEEPFNKFPNESKELQWLSATKVKSELSKKFYKEISIEKIEENGKKRKEMEKTYNTISNRHRSDESAGKNEKEETKNKLELDKFKLESIVQVLSQEVYERDMIINEQSKELERIKNHILILEKKANVVITHMIKKKKKEEKLKTLKSQ